MSITSGSRPSIENQSRSLINIFYLLSVAYVALLCADYATCGRLARVDPAASEDAIDEAGDIWRGKTLWESGIGGLGGVLISLREHEIHVG